MAFIRIRTINGKEYVYQEVRWRGSDGKVKSKSIYLGPGRSPPGSTGGGFLGGLLRPIPPEQQGLRYIERLMEKDAARSNSVRVGTWMPRGTKDAADKLMAEGQRLTEERERLQAAKEKLSRELGVTFGPANPTPVEKRSAPAAVPSESQQAAPVETASPNGDSDGSAGNTGAGTSE